MKLLLIIMAVMICSCSHSILFYPTGISSYDGMCYIYQPVDKNNVPTRPPDLYYCDCELELRGKKVYLKGTKIQLTDENTTTD